jgi:hypothetical protein
MARPQFDTPLVDTCFTMVAWPNLRNSWGFHPFLYFVLNVVLGWPCCSSFRSSLKCCKFWLKVICSLQLDVYNGLHLRKSLFFSSLAFLLWFLKLSSQALPIKLSSITLQNRLSFSTVVNMSFTIPKPKSLWRRKMSGDAI